MDEERRGREGGKKEGGYISVDGRREKREGRGMSEGGCRSVEKKEGGCRSVDGRREGRGEGGKKEGGYRSVNGRREGRGGGGKENR